MSKGQISKRNLQGKSFKIYSQMRKEAKEGLDLYERFSSRSKMTTGLWRATQLLRWDRLPLEDAKVMSAWFKRHAVDAEAAGSKSNGFWGDDDNPSPGWIAFKCWGGYSSRDYINALEENQWKQVSFNSV